MLEEGVVWTDDGFTGKALMDLTGPAWREIEPFGHGLLGYKILQFGIVFASD
jgi:hypothetical protein